MMPHWCRHFYHHHHQVTWQAHNMTQPQWLMAQCHGPPPSPLPPPPPSDVAGLQHDTATTLIVSSAQTTHWAHRLGFGMFFFFHFLLFYFTNEFVFYGLMTVDQCPNNTTFTPTTTFPPTTTTQWRGRLATWRWQWQPDLHCLISPNDVSNTLFGLWYFSKY